MKKILLIPFFIVFFIINANSQVSIGKAANEPHADAILDLQSSDKGFLLPRVELVGTDKASPMTSHVAGMSVYNTVVSGSGATYVSPGLYYNDGTQWVRLPLSFTNWFYMPSIAFDTSADAVGQTKNLYEEYQKQFDGTSPRFVKSTGAPGAIPYLAAPGDLYYYITDYDPAVFSNVSINPNGIMTYDVTAAASDCTYINIVFVLK